MAHSCISYRAWNNEGMQIQWKSERIIVPNEQPGVVISMIESKKSMDAVFVLFPHTLGWVSVFHIIPA